MLIQTRVQPMLLVIQVLLLVIMVHKKYIGWQQENRQWGEASGSTASPKTTFPIAFSSAVYRIVNTFNKNNPIGDAYHMNECIPKNITTSSFTMWVDNETAAKFDYIAIGK